MKLGIALLLLSACGANTQPPSSTQGSHRIVTHDVANFTSFNVDDNLVDFDVVSARLTIAPDGERISVLLRGAASEMTREFSAPIERTSVGRDGSTLSVAIDDGTPVDAPKTVIKLTDYRTSDRKVDPNMKTRVSLSVTNPWTATTLWGEFSGPAIHRNFEDQLSLVAVSPAIADDGARVNIYGHGSFIRARYYRISFLGERLVAENAVVSENADGSVTFGSLLDGGYRITLTEKGDAGDRRVLVETTGKDSRVVFDEEATIYRDRR